MTTHDLCCTECGAVHPIDDLTEFNEQLLCEECLDRLTVICSDCGERIWRSANAGTDALPLCEGCRDEDYTSCTRCGCLLQRDSACYIDDEDDPYCDDCYEEVSTRPIKCYDYKPESIFYGDNSRYFGVELEIDGATINRMP